MSFSGDLHHFLSLNISPNNASISKIKTAFKRAALLYHPDKNSDPRANEKFLRAKEAYDHLMSAFGASNESRKSPRKSPSPLVRKQVPIVVHVDATLEEILTGTTKQVTVCRMAALGRLEDITLPFVIRPGSQAGKRTYHHMQGHRGFAGLDHGDVIFVLRILKHNKFRRIGHTSNLRTTIEIDFADTLRSADIELEVPILAGPPLVVMIDGPIYGDHTVQRISGQGLPLSDNVNMRGDLIVRINVKYPSHLTPEKRKKLGESLIGQC